jgi:membrane protease YdiL (CAAX protease family)
MKNKKIKYVSLIDPRAKTFNTITLTIILGWAVVLTGGFFTRPEWIKPFMLKLLGHSSLEPMYEYMFRYFMVFLAGFIMPLIIIKLIHKESFQLFGLTWGPDKLSRKIGLWWLIGLCIIIIPVTFFVSKNPQLRAVYPLCEFAKSSFGIFLLYQGFYIMAIAGYEFLYRGFLQCGIATQFGRSAIVVQVLATTILHYQSPPLQTLLVFIVGAFAGMLNFRTKSFFYIFIAHAWLAFWFDFWCLFV